MRCLICLREEGLPCRPYICVTCSTKLGRVDLYRLLLNSYNDMDAVRKLTDRCIADISADGVIERDDTAQPLQWIIGDFIDVLGEGYQEDCEFILVFAKDGYDGSEGYKWLLVECVDVQRLDYIMEFRMRLDKAEASGCTPGRFQSDYVWKLCVRPDEAAVDKAKDNVP